MYWLRWDLNLKVRLFGEGIFHIFMWMVFPFMALHFTESFGKDAAGLLLMVPPLLGIVASLIGGQLSDRIGRRPAMIFASAMESAMFVLFALSSSPWVDYLAFIGLSVAGSIYWPASAAMVTDLTTEEERRKVFATFYTTMNIGVVVGPIIGSMFFIHHRTALFVVCAAVSMLLTTLLFVLIKESLPASARKMREQANTPKEQWRSYAVIFRDKMFALYIMAGILVAIVFMQMDLYMGIYIKEHVPEQTLFTWGDWSFTVAPTEVFGWLIGLNGLMVVLFTLLVTRMFSHWNDRNALVLSSILSGIGMFAMGLTANVWLLFGCMVLFTLGELIRTPVAQTFVSKYAPEESRGQYMGASTLQFSIGRFLAPAAIGLSQWLPPLGVFGVILLCALISALLYVRLFRLLAKFPRKTSQEELDANAAQEAKQKKAKPEVV
ncbi:MFS transporter [Brevibacillus humidisoli]|uniref:MDR family MFS transporter n=1 Tax=Brevibacillus humidisoli TaxID=2895522 RepID=UPI001E28B28A|nr:MFS transporter [Brevibacillus humidisoli]UFJ40239.1 MFS transporter [Brevibacillus humidisoli]